jgi:HD-GYP domain-containing protein (c-di-GMP phosphodiesterase class II)
MYSWTRGVPDEHTHGVEDVPADAVMEAERLRVSLARRAQRLVSRERQAELAVGGGFLLGASALVVLAPPIGHLELGLAVAYLVCAAAATQVRFDIAGGITVPIQVVFVPMLLAIPAALTPLLLMMAWVLGMLPAVLTGRLAPSRLLTAPGNSWFALGPALVLVLAGSRHPIGDPGLLSLALAAQFAGDFLSNLLRERLRGGPTSTELAGEVSRIYLMDLALSPIGLAVAFATSQHSWAVLCVLPLFGVMSVFSREREARMEQLIELNDAYRGTALVLGDVVEADDAYTGEHCRGVVRLSVEVARALGLDSERCRNVEFGALLHDVGKIAIPNEIINKPGKLDEQEWAIVKMHTIEGQRMLETVGGLMSNVGRVVRSSHEHWDGTGYPDGLRGEDILLEARIVSACDAFDAMTTTRSYRKGMSVDVAVAELTANSGTQFDPAVVAALLEVLEHPSPTTQAASLATQPSLEQALGEPPRAGAASHSDLPTRS